MWLTTVGRQTSASYSYDDGGLLPAGYHRDRVPAGANLSHAQFAPGLLLGGRPAADLLQASLKPGAWSSVHAVAPRAGSRRDGIAAVERDWDR